MICAYCNQCADSCCLNKVGGCNCHPVNQVAHGPVLVMPKPYTWNGVLYDNPPDLKVGENIEYVRGGFSGHKTYKGVVDYVWASGMFSCENDQGKRITMPEPNCLRYWRRTNVTQPLTYEGALAAIKKVWTPASKMVAPPGGMTCKKCKSRNPDAGPNTTSGEYVCYECR